MRGNHTAVKSQPMSIRMYVYKHACSHKHALWDWKLFWSHSALGKRAGWKYASAFGHSFQRRWGATGDSPKHNMKNEPRSKRHGL